MVAHGIQGHRSQMDVGLAVGSTAGIDQHALDQHVGHQGHDGHIRAALGIVGRGKDPAQPAGQPDAATAFIEPPFHLPAGIGQVGGCAENDTGTLVDVVGIHGVFHGKKAGLAACGGQAAGDDFGHFTGMAGLAVIDDGKFHVLDLLQEAAAGKARAACRFTSVPACAARRSKDQGR